MLKYINFLGVLVSKAYGLLPPIPNEGKFFYATLEMESDNTMSLNTLVGDTESTSAPKFKLGISTGGHSLELFSSDPKNDQCNVK